MQIDLRTVTIEPKRNAFDHLVERFGDKPASRYQEGSYDIQASENLHYRPTWDPDQELYDPNLTKIVMEDWYAFKDPRQFFYNTYVLARARQQESVESNFRFVENHGLAETLPAETKAKILNLLIPLRHAAWAANQNNTFICGYGCGTTFTQACIYHAFDNFGIAQYLSRIGLLMGGKEALAKGKDDWVNGEVWQSMRKYAEDTMVVRDPFELFIAQNLAFDGLLYPLVYEKIVDGLFVADGVTLVSMLTQFMSDWHTETRKWVDSVVKIAAAESDANSAILKEWIEKWSDRAGAAIVPALSIALGVEADNALAEQYEEFRDRVKKTKIEI